MRASGLAAYRGSVSIASLEHAAATAAWISAALQGACGVEHAIDVVRGVDAELPFGDTGAGFPPRFAPHEETEQLSLAFAIARWRAQGVAGWRYLPVAPGDAAGLPGPSAFSVAVMDCGVGLLSTGGRSLGLVTQPHDDHVVWREYEVAGGAPLTAVALASEAERELLDALNGSVDLLDRLDLGHWRADARDVRDEWSDPTPMPPGTGPRAERLALRSRRVLQLVELAMVDDGGSRTAAEMAMRRTSLGGLARAARHAHAAAWNTALLDAGQRR